MSLSKFALKLAVAGLFVAAVLASRLWLGETSAPAQPTARVDDKAARPLRSVGTVQPRLSPDGKQTAFSYQGCIWRLPTEGGTMRRLTTGPGLAVEPCWSPDSKRLAFLQGRNWGSGLVKLIDADTGKAIPIPTEGEVLGSGPLHFTPDGERIIGNLRGTKQVDALRSLDIKTGKLELVQILRMPRQPWALSADGKWVALVTSMDIQDEQGGNDGPQADLWKVPLAGGEPERVVRFPARIHGLCWSADGKSLFASTELGGVFNDIWRIDLADPDKPVQLTFGQADEDRPSVSRDGRWLLYADNHEGAPALVLHDLRAGLGKTLTIDRLDAGVPTGRLRLKVQEKSSGQAAVARVTLEHQDGSFPAPPGALWRIFRDAPHFYVREQVEFDVPAGKYTLRAWHGPECRTTKIELAVQPDMVTEQAVLLERWIDLNGKGWYSGDNHIHANYGYGEYHNTPASMADMIAGEDLNVGNFMVANSDGDGTFDRAFFRGRPDPLSTPRHVLYWNEEFRSTIWGHMTLVNLRQVVEPVFMGFKDTTNPYDIPSMSEISERTRRQGGVVNYTHPASRIEDLYRGPYTARGLPVYAPLGKIDTMDVMGSGGKAATAYYHRLLNCGIRIGASAGTDVFLNRIRSNLPGDERVYVKIDGPFTYAKWIDGLRAGRTFVSNGPFIELTVNGKQLSDTIELKAAGEVQVKASASSQFPLDKVEVLYNGQVVASARLDKGALTASIDQSVKLERSGWLALRALGPAVFETKGDGIYAHTSPIYVTVAGKPAGNAADARYFLAWIDRLWTAVQERDRIPGEHRKAEIAAEIDKARKFYQAIVEREK